MHLRHAITTLALAIFCIEGVLGQEAWQQRRQDNTDTATANTIPDTTSSPLASSQGTTSTTDDSTSRPTTATSTGQNARETSSDRTTRESTITTSPTASSTTVDATSSSMPSSTIESAIASPTPTSLPDALPIVPKITPAVGLVGVVLMATGVALCLIGIKHEWLYIFLSSAFLASLAVTVLIVYVMNPPVSDAMQGAYFVAAFLTGVSFGAVSLIFREVTDGLGCMLGGFCLAMWFLVLAPGGIIHSTAGRGVLIGVFCVVCFALSFSRYTRTYGLIGCTSFAGAMITVMGADCFSRAGLKEFWLYLWDLNSDEFPLDTNTYPITRGIRVEIACTVVLFLFGLMSQMKLWKVVKERRDKREAERIRDEEDRDQREHAVGKVVEANNERDLRRWEAVYGDKKTVHTHADSGVGSSVETFGKGPSSVREREVDAIEIVDVPRVQSRFSVRSNRDRRMSGIVRASTDGEIAQAAGESREMLIEAAVDPESVSHFSTKRNSLESNRTHDHTHMNDGLTAPFAPGAPAIVPLPFSLPTDSEDKLEEAERESIHSRGTIAQPAQEQKKVRLEKLSLMRLNEMHGSGPSAPRGDQASSIAATADDELRVDALSTHRLSAYSAVPDVEPSKNSYRPVSLDARTLDPNEPVEVQEEEDEEALTRPATAADTYRSPSATQRRGSLTSSRHGTSAGKRSGQDDGFERPESPSIAESMVDTLPPKFSKIAMTYRTNEWAKHIADADLPQNEDSTAEPPSPGIQIDHAFVQEAAKPVDVEALKQTTTVERAPSSLERNSSKASERPAVVNTYVPSPKRASSAQSITPVYAFNNTRSSSAMSLNCQTSSGSLAKAPRLATPGMRNSTAPLLSQILVESPIEEGIATSGPYRPVVSPSPSSSNLLDQRTQRLARRTTSTSFNALTSSTPNLNLIATSDTASSPIDNSNTPFTPDAEENLTLTQRRSQMQQTRRTSDPNTSLSPTRQLSSPLSPTHEGIIYDSHQPARSSSALSHSQQTARLTQWRQSLQPQTRAPVPLVVDESARQAMIKQQRQSELAEQRRREERGRRESLMDAAMRSGQLNGAHRDAMRRMQAKANRSDGV